MPWGGELPGLTVAASHPETDLSPKSGGLPFIICFIRAKFIYLRTGSIGIYLHNVRGGFATHSRILGWRIPRTGR